MIDIRYDMDYGMDYGMIGMKYGDFHVGSGRRCPRRPAREATWKAPARCDVVRCCQFEVRQHVRDRGEQPFPSGVARPRAVLRAAVLGGTVRAALDNAIGECARMRAW